MPDDNSGKPKGPSHHAFSVRNNPDPQGKAFFNRVGSAFPHKDGKGFNVDLEAMPVNGKIVLRTPQERLKDAKDGGGKDQGQPRERD